MCDGTKCFPSMSSDKVVGFYSSLNIQNSTFPLKKHEDFISLMQFSCIWIYVINKDKRIINACHLRHLSYRVNANQAGGWWIFYCVAKTGRKNESSVHTMIMHVLSDWTLISLYVNGWTETVCLLCKQSFVLSGD